jgi:tRNA A-37 threonylcarbamoyl transferase component Bud32
LVVVIAEVGEVRYCTICRAVYHSEFARCPNDGGALALSSVDPLLGTTVAHYEIDAYVGGGAMGRVYRCHHTHLQHKHFALKVLRGDLAATLAMRLRFTQEAEAASRLVHPNVVSVTDFGRTDDGLLYLAMDYVEGDNLATWIEAGPISPEHTIDIVRQLCHGLGHAHSLGLVHRDLKPENVIVLHDGTVRIVDFGLAIHTGGDAETARLTSAGATVGTPVYAAPEQMQTEDVDQRADLFALGVTMFEMLAGRTPFDGNLLEVLHMNISGERPTIASRARLPVTVPPRLEKLVHRLMSSSRNDRPTSTNDVLAELDAIERGVDDTVAPPLKRKRAWIVGIAGAAIAAGAAVAIYMAMRPPPGEPLALSLPVVAPPKPTAPKPPPPKVEAVTTVQFDAIEPAPMIPEPAVPLATRRSPAKERPTPTRTVAKVVGKVDTVADAKPDKIDATAKPDSVGDGAAEVKPDKVGDVKPDSGGVKADPVGDASTATKPDTGVKADASRAKPDKVADTSGKPVIWPTAKVATSAKLSLDGLSVRGSLTTAQVKRALDRVSQAVRGCYGPSAKQAGRSPKVALRTRFEIDETQHARAIQTTPAGGDLPGLSACVDRALLGLWSEQAPDVGTVDVSLVLQFSPEGT